MGVGGGTVEVPQFHLQRKQHYGHSLFPDAWTRRHSPTPPSKDPWNGGLP